MRSALRSTCFGFRVVILIMTAMIPNGLACQQDPSGVLVLRLSRTAKQLVRIDEAGRDTDTVFQSQAGALWLPTVSPNGQLAAVVELARGAGENRLLILDGRGTVVRVVGRNVQAYDWSGDASTIAFVTGTPRDGGEPPFLPTGVFLADVVGGSVQAVPVPDGAYSVAWAGFDSSLYVKVGLRKPGESVYRIDSKSRRAEATPYFDFHFSPSGHFYLFYNRLVDSVGYGWQLVERTTGQRLAVPQGLGSIEGWASSEGDFLSLVRAADSTAATSSRPFVRTGTEAGAVVRTLYDAVRGITVSQVAEEGLARMVEARNTRSLMVSGRLQVVRPPLAR